MVCQKFILPILAMSPLIVFSPLFGDGSPLDPPQIYTPNSSSTTFSAKIIGNRVRLRAEPSTDSEVIKELNKGDLILVSGEKDGFFAVTPSGTHKAYIYRTFVLDGKVEGKNVNVRLHPTLDAPVIAQLQTGDKIHGEIYSEDSKWLEITLPEQVKFYVASEYVERVGDASYIREIDRRLEEASNLLTSIYLMGKSELMKEYKDINLDPLRSLVERLKTQYAEFAEHASKAEYFLSKINDQYLQIKIAYLESKSENSQASWRLRNETLAQELESQKERMARLQKELEQTTSKKQELEQWAHPGTGEQVTDKMAAWIPVEMAIFTKWKTQHPNKLIQDFYQSEIAQSAPLRGVIERYDRPVRNRPGDYILMNARTRMPIAYLYSTQVDLNTRVGEEIQLRGSLRPNNHFAYPAYFVLDVE